MNTVQNSTATKKNAMKSRSLCPILSPCLQMCSDSSPPYSSPPRLDCMKDINEFLAPWLLVVCTGTSRMQFAPWQRLEDRRRTREGCLSHRVLSCSYLGHGSDQASLSTLPPSVDSRNQGHTPLLQQEGWLWLLRLPALGRCSFVNSLSLPLFKMPTSSVPSVSCWDSKRHSLPPNFVLVAQFPSPETNTAISFCVYSQRYSMHYKSISYIYMYLYTCMYILF